MTVSTTNTTISYEGNGSTKQFSYSFPSGPGPNIHVFVSDANGSTEILTNLTIAPNPPVAPNPTSTGGTVTYPVSGAPLAVGSRLTIMRDVPSVQPTSYVNQGTIYQETIEKSFDYVTMDLQELHADDTRQVLLPPGEVGPLILPGCPARAGKLLAFDANCQPIAVGNVDFIASKNAIRGPETEILTELPDAAHRPGTLISFDGQGQPILIAKLPPNVEPLFGSLVSVTAPRSVANEESGFLFVLSGNTFFDLTFGDPATYDVDFSCAVFNADIYTGPGSGRAKRITFNGTIMPGGLLWPGQWIYIFKIGSAFVTNPRDQRWKPGVAPTIYVDTALGADDGTSDGLATGVGATKTIAAAVALAQDRLDYGGILINFGALIQLAAGVYQESVYIGFPTVGGNPITIQGAVSGAPNAWQIQVGSGLSGIQVDQGATVNLVGLNFGGSLVGVDAVGVTASRSAVVNVSNCRFAAFGGTKGFHLHVYDQATLNVRDITVAGSVASHLVVRRQATARLSGVLTVVSSLAFTDFMVTEYQASIVGGPSIFGDPTDFSLVKGTGYTGRRYRAQFGSIMNLGVGIADTLPGNVAGIFGGTSPLHSNAGDTSCVY